MTWIVDGGVYRQWRVGWVIMSIVIGMVIADNDMSRVASGVIGGVCSLLVGLGLLSGYQPNSESLTFTDSEFIIDFVRLKRKIPLRSIKKVVLEVFKEDQQNTDQFKSLRIHLVDGSSIKVPGRKSMHMFIRRVAKEYHLPIHTIVDNTKWSGG